MPKYPYLLSAALIMFKGSDGKYHAFLLKGHEDLRLDERIMQLVGLMNTMLSRDREAFKRRLSVTGYPVVPLSPSSGLISWLNNKDASLSLPSANPFLTVYDRLCMSSFAITVLA